MDHARDCAGNIDQNQRSDLRFGAECAVSVRCSDGSRDGLVFGDERVRVARSKLEQRITASVCGVLAPIGFRSSPVLRDGKPLEVSVTDVVPGDVVVLSAGWRASASALRSACWRQSPVLLARPLRRTRYTRGGPDFQVRRLAR
jgi:hypothetical protein